MQWNTPQAWDEATLTADTLGAEFHGVGGDSVDRSRVFNLNAEEGANVNENVNNAVSAQTLSGDDVASLLNARVADSGLATFITTVDAGAVRG